MFNLFMQLDESQKFLISNIAIKDYLKKSGKNLPETFFLPLKINELKKIKEVNIFI